ncbi:hypothetical protein LMH87_011181 [Akanthomyces muscarius]|uniref:Copalyl diphosphate synthase n=1 Tax=Akanthomyces muscarius TaxID=2231603 RepID=A0A9W8Q976_AKAMU|nr:hypothetical protein LMH87_011181 [Akanthomyces muscarius]KAJ4150431.1 hypothetical protein LMH87_011181 [Akanthomyces muscarius]
MGSKTAPNVTIEDLIVRSKFLLQTIAQNTHEKYGFGTLTCTIYDSAWVALVKKPDQTGKVQWLFPESFAYIIKMQCADGGWMSNTKAQVDGILNTMAGLLVLKRYTTEPLQVALDQGHMAEKLERALDSLRSQLDSWDASTSNNVGFEVIVPAMLDLLAAEDPSLVFHFQAKPDLLEVYQAKLSRFKPEFLYGNDFVTATHSLEAFIGRLDFDRIKHHKMFGSFFASPSSTAAYLMNVSEWDEEAEAYLRHVVAFSVGQGNGGVPGVFPTTNFEYIWVLSTLLRSGFSVLELASPELNSMTEMLLQTYEESEGVVGLAPGIEADVDDTAKLITTLGYLGETVQPQRLIEVFEVQTHFRVYQHERDASFSANCNALIALLHPGHCDMYCAQIRKLAEFLCNRKWNADACIRDKWNTSHLYSSLLFAEAFTDLLYLVEQDHLAETFSESFLRKAGICLYQTCLRPLLDQCSNGSWGDSIEETAYAVSILGEAQKLVFFQDLQQILRAAIDEGIDYILSFATTKMSHHWSDKVSYGSHSITEAYILAALRQATVPFTGAIGCSIFGNATVEKSARQIELFHKTPLLECLPRWEVVASLIDAELFERFIDVPKLQFLPSNSVQGGAYLKLVPFTWTSCSNRSRSYASPSFLHEMMVLSFFTYQADEFMESIAGPSFHGRYGILRSLIDKATFHPLELPLSLEPELNEQVTKADAEISQQLSQCVDFLLNNDVIQQASFHDRRNLRQELRHFFLAHTAQAQDNLRYVMDIQLEDKVVCSVSHSYARWVATTSADHIAGPFCFAFALCVIGASLPSRTLDKDCFPLVVEKYYAASASTHLSIMCRMYNDIGSWERDNRENNLNSLHFEEFATEVKAGSQKLALYGLAQYERGCWNEALSLLQAENNAKGNNSMKQCGNRRINLVRLFCDVTDIYGQIYLLKDISSPIAVRQRTAAA